MIIGKIRTLCVYETGSIYEAEAIVTDPETINRLIKPNIADILILARLLFPDAVEFLKVNFILENTGEANQIQ